MSGQTSFSILVALSVAHFLNDMMQSLLLALYPLLKAEMQLSFSQIGFITLAWQLTASLLQPLVGAYTDRYPQPYSLVFGMACTFAGLFILALAPSLSLIYIAAALIGAGSAIFHPESSRVARFASGGRHGLAQSIFQVGGNFGSAAGPLAAVWIVLPQGQRSIIWFCSAAGIALLLLFWIGRWYQHQHRIHKSVIAQRDVVLPQKQVVVALAVLLALIFSKFFYLASINNFLIFYLMQQFKIDVASAQYHLFIYLFSVAAGTLVVGPIGDRIGRKRVIWISIIGIIPFALALPYVGLEASAILTVIIGFMLASAFPAMLVYAQELIPGRVGTISGLFFGLAFGLASIGAALLGQLADHWGIVRVYELCSFLPLLGLLALFLPDLRSSSRAVTTATSQVSVRSH